MGEARQGLKHRVDHDRVEVVRGKAGGVLGAPALLALRGVGQVPRQQSVALTDLQDPAPGELPDLLRGAAPAVAQLLVSQDLLDEAHASGPGGERRPDLEGAGVGGARVRGPGVGRGQVQVAVGAGEVEDGPVRYDDALGGGAGLGGVGDVAGVVRSGRRLGERGGARGDLVGVGVEVHDRRVEALVVVPAPGPGENRPGGAVEDDRAAALGGACGVDGYGGRTGSYDGEQRDHGVRSGAQRGHDPVAGPYTAGPQVGGEAIGGRAQLPVREGEGAPASLGQVSAVASGRVRTYCSTRSETDRTDITGSS